MICRSKGLAGCVNGYPHCVSIGLPSSQNTKQDPAAGVIDHPPAVVVSAALAGLWGPRVGRLRAEAGLSQLALARRCAVSQQTISKLERGRIVPTDPLKLRIAHALQADPGELFGWPDQPLDQPNPWGESG
jgi:DNA-binding XRE family transcriptional regulator